MAWSVIRGAVSPSGRTTRSARDRTSWRDLMVRPQQQREHLRPGDQPERHSRRGCCLRLGRRTNRLRQLLAARAGRATQSCAATAPPGAQPPCALRGVLPRPRCEIRRRPVVLGLPAACGGRIKRSLEPVQAARRRLSADGRGRHRLGRPSSPDPGRAGRTCRRWGCGGGAGRAAPPTGVSR